MAIDPVSVMQSANSSNSSDGSSNAASAAASATINYNDFLQLLIAQMKDQDPTEPMDASAQISQLASFSQVEQQIQTNSNLETMLKNQYVSQAADYIGKQIMSADGTVTGTVKEVNIYSDGVIAVTTDGDKVLVQAGVTVAPAGTSIDKPTTTTTSGDESDSDSSS